MYMTKVRIVFCLLLSTYLVTAYTQSSQSTVSHNYDDDDDDGGDDAYTGFELFLDVLLVASWLFKDPSKVGEKLVFVAAALITVSLLTIILDLCGFDFKRLPRDRRNNRYLVRSFLAVQVFTEPRSV